jgi:oxygen-independent coproporphyrinogen-3 oxidase
VDRYVAALVKEIESSTPGSAIDTIYFGGGTPSLLSPKQLVNILDTVRSKFSVEENSEVTMEMNPATVTAESLKEYKSLGVNRASFGVQTFDNTELKRLARGHDAQDARNTFRLLREAGFNNVSFDLIAGLPRQTLTDWERNLEEALLLAPEHMSLYLLEIHEGTPLATQIRDGRQPMPDETLAAEMYELMLDKVTAAGYEQYEISNFAKPGFESKHNSKYWQLEPVYGYGVSAHSFDGFQRYANERDTAKYVQRIEEFGTAEAMRERIDAASEFVFLGLRLNNGIDLIEYKDRYDVDLREKYSNELTELSNAGLIVIDEANFRLTKKGMLFSNEVFRVFI